MLVLFDIDGTLISAKGAGRRALSKAIEQETGVLNALDGVRLHGSTDPVILDEAYAQHVGRPIERPAEATRVLSLYLGFLQQELERSAGAYEVMPGAADLVEALHDTGRHVVGLATGNVESAAMIKLEPGGLARHFEFGGYGSDAGVRSELVRAGIRRGQARAEARFGAAFPPEEVVVIGDTERDVQAAHAAGARAVGVLVGSGHPDLLEDSKPDLIVRTLADEALWRFLAV